MFGEDIEQRRFYIHHVEDLFPKRFDALEKSFLQKSGILDKSNESYKRNLVLNRYEEGSSLSVDEVDEPLRNQLQIPNLKTRDSLPGQPNKRRSESFGGHNSNLNVRNQKPRASI